VLAVPGMFGLLGVLVIWHDAPDWLTMPLAIIFIVGGAMIGLAAAFSKDE